MRSRKAGPLNCISPVTLSPGPIERFAIEIAWNTGSGGF
jgi:hypothetical protein